MKKGSQQSFKQIQLMVTRIYSKNVFRTIYCPDEVYDADRVDEYIESDERSKKIIDEEFEEEPFFLMKETYSYNVEEVKDIGKGKEKNFNSFEFKDKDEEK